MSLERGLCMRIEEVSQITQRMVFLRIYEVLVESNQSILDRRDYKPENEVLQPVEWNNKDWIQYDAGYPFCYFTGEVLNDLLRQPVIWNEQHLILEDAVAQLQPDLESWLTDDVRQVKINDFFNWQPHTLRVQELVDDVKQRVLDVVDAIHSAEKIQMFSESPHMMHVVLGKDKAKHLITGGVTHSLSYRMIGSMFKPVLHDAVGLSQKWYMHALIHGLWLITQQEGHIRLDTVEKESGSLVRTQTPLYLV